MFSKMKEPINVLLILGVFMIQQNNNLIGFIGFSLITIISYIEIKKLEERKRRYYYIGIISSEIKKNFGIYDNLYNQLVSSINNKEYQRIDIMKTYSQLLNIVNDLDYDFDKINNCSDIFCFLVGS